jgi:uncharacterized membrane protein YhaH (DUF805 family)
LPLAPFSNSSEDQWSGNAEHPDYLQGARNSLNEERLVTFNESIQICFKKYAEFGGRASKSEFWWWSLFVLLISMGARIISDDAASLVFLGTLLPYLAVSSRRLHDIGRSGWWQLVGFIPLFGWAIMIYWCVQDPVRPNSYG